ncbi:hypothetical protein B0O99DRAFT_688053 [Bisporella sp. PMI_857]|nr:hypothetical protein B0O99DRAFT_688053 [Bisporella sp. PMI_857]
MPEDESLGPRTKPRISAPKSRNGCLTCKTRRVKCDENHPICHACVKSRRRCEWKAPKDQLKKTRQILPQNGLPLNNVRPTQILPFIDQREAYYFWAYQDEAAVELAGAVKSSPWTYTMLQAARAEPFVLRSLVAIGALNKCLKVGHAAKTGPSALRLTNQELSDQHRKFALAAYDRAIVGMKNITLEQQSTISPLRKALLACLLVWTIEFFLRSPNNAYYQWQSGYKLLRNLYNYEKSESISGISSPDPNTVDEEIFHEFSRLDWRGAILWGERKNACHHYRRLDGQIAIRDMPVRFSDLNEARVYHELLMRRTYNLIGEAFAAIMATKEDERHLMIVDSPGELLDPCHIPTSLLTYRDAYLDDLKRWNKAFQHIFPRSAASKDMALSLGAMMLRCHSLSAEIALAGAFFTEECMFDRSLPEMKEIVDLAGRIEQKRLLHNPDGLPVLNFELDSELPLHDVAIFCREKEVRYEALSLLRSQACLDTSGHRSRVYTRASYLVSLEEKERDKDGYIPEKARYRRVWVLNHYADVERHLTLLYVRRLGYPIGKGYPAKREYTWRTFSYSEAESMIFNDIPGQQLWPVSIIKPMALRWKEIHKELLDVRPLAW